MTPSIETHSRRGAEILSLVLTMAQQAVGQGMSQSMEKAILNSAKLQIGGTTQPIFQSAIAKLFPVEPAEIGSLNTGEFYVKAAGKAPYRITVPTTHLGNAGAMSPTHGRTCAMLNSGSSTGRRTCHRQHLLQPLPDRPNARQRKTPSPPTWYDAHRMKKVTFLLIARAGATGILLF